MHAVQRVQDLLEEQLVPMHAARKAVLFAAVEALVRGGELVLREIRSALLDAQEAGHRAIRMHWMGAARRTWRWRPPQGGLLEV